ncbi:hypothetical protein [Zhongshania arctica]|uniref:Uncharacterized protein n=1 Tax=Zhongshania arctica TaxID=3238302 RepID=A0ABV3TYH8_9GAMM
MAVPAEGDNTVLLSAPITKIFSGLLSIAPTTLTVLSNNFPKETNASKEKQPKDHSYSDKY